MNKIEEKAAELREQISVEALEKATRPMRLSDLMRQGSTVTEQCEQGWGNGDTACALSAAAIAAKAHGIL